MSHVSEQARFAHTRDDDRLLAGDKGLDRGELRFIERHLGKDDGVHAIDEGPRVRHRVLHAFDRSWLGQRPRPVIKVALAVVGVSSVMKSASATAVGHGNSRTLKTSISS